MAMDVTDRKPTLHASSGKYDIGYANNLINQYMDVPAAYFSNDSSLGRSMDDHTRLLQNISKFGGQGASAFDIISHPPTDYSAMNYWSESGQAVARIITLAGAPNLDSGLKKVVTKELSKINAARAVKNLPLIDLLGQGTSTESLLNPVASQQAADDATAAIEKQVKDTLDSILKVSGQGAQSTSESTQAYTNRVDEMRKLQVRGMLNSFTGFAATPVKPDIPQTRASALGGV